MNQRTRSRDTPSRPHAGTGIGVYLFGRMRVECAGRPVTDLNCSKARELLAYLLLHPGRPHRREAVADLLWGHEPGSEPRKTLRQALWRLKSNLNLSSPMFEPIGDEWIQLNPEKIWADVGAFETAWLEVEPYAHDELPDHAWVRAREALDLYRGELLEGSRWDWCSFERERFRNLFLTMGDAVMSRCLVEDDLSEGIRLGFEILRHDPAREKTHQRLMTLHAMRGDRSMALRQYECCAAALEHELGVGPSQRTRELLARIRDDRLPAEGVPPAERPRGEMAGVLEGLRQLRALLSEARHEVHLEIQAIERALDRKT